MSTSPDQPLADDQLALWEFAGLLTTYWCNAACEFCYVYSSPRLGGRLEPDLALSIWSSLHELAARHGHTMRIHLAGGEPFGDWPHLLSLVSRARRAGLPPVEKIETNAFWATSDGLTRSRLEQLAALGVERLVVSCDVYHQQFVPFERVRRCVEIARQVLCRGRVRVRWWDFYNQPLDPRPLSAAQRRAAFAAAMARHRDRLTGRAAERLADLLELHPPEAFAQQNCVSAVLHSRHVHIDPYGHVFPGVCSGIILGNAARHPPADLWHHLAANWRDHPIVSAVVTGGSYALMQLALRHGYQPRPAGYADKCHLCHHVRSFLFERGRLREWLGPGECYGRPTPPGTPLPVIDPPPAKEDPS